jgi:hypothetical protein
MFADRKFPHSFEDQQLDLGDLREVDERLDLLFTSPHARFP